jgi:dihydroorotate dehydrogenase electron transfer subunit
MSRPAASPSFVQRTAGVVENVALARQTYRIRLHVPELARRIRPGQFLMLRLPGSADPLLGRPFALYDTVLDSHDEPVAVDVVYLVVGKLTGLLAAVRAGEAVEVWGPLGNGFPSYQGAEHVGMVAGGIGQTPFLALARQLLGTRGYGGQPARREAKRVSLYYGVRSADLAAGVEDFQAAGADILLTSDDGSIGYKGYITDALRSITDVLHPASPNPDRLVGCGPGPMLGALATLARDRNIPCDVSLETPMACGFGVCFSCVTRVCTADGWDYRRVCVEGPVFNAAELDWNGSAG